MRLEQISYFLSVAEHGNITAAARSLYISQPALSKQITLLEQEIGLPLFERQARGVTLTRAGMQFQKDLKNILKELENAKKNAVLAGRAQKPLLNMGRDGRIFKERAALSERCLDLFCQISAGKERTARLGRFPG